MRRGGFETRPYIPALACDLELGFLPFLQYALEVVRHDLDELGQNFIPLLEHAPCPFAPAPLQMALDHPVQELYVLLALDGLQADHVHVAQGLEASRLVEDERDTTAHPGCEVATRLAEHNDDPARHVLASVIPDALDYCVGA